MSNRKDRTTRAGSNGAFQTTHWTEIFNARSADEPRRREALEGLIGRYWKPVYCYLRCKGYDREAARDLTQGFFHEVALGQGLIREADRTKGRFRTFLLICLNRYVGKVRRSQQAKRRMPEGGLVSLEELGWLNVPEPVHYTTPRQAFDYAWASALLDQVLAEVAGECRETGGATHWELFRERILRPVMENAAPPSLSLLCEKYGIPKKAMASNMIFTMKRFFRVALRRRVRQFVDSDAEVHDEICYLMRILSGSRARL